jgi:hypothetical protein
MSDQKRYRVKLKRAQSFTMPNGKTIMKGRPLFVKAGDPRLAYFERNFLIFKVDDCDNLVEAQLPASLVRRRRRDKAREEGKQKPGEQPKAKADEKAPEPEPKAPEGETGNEPSVKGAAIEYTEAKLKRLKRSELVEIAEDEFGLEVGADALKREIVAMILAFEE